MSERPDDRRGSSSKIGRWVTGDVRRGVTSLSLARSGGVPRLLRTAVIALVVCFGPAASARADPPWSPPTRAKGSQPVVSASPLLGPSDRPEALALDLRTEEPSSAFAPLDPAGVPGPIEAEGPYVSPAAVAGDRTIFFRPDGIPTTRPDRGRLRLAIAPHGQRPPSGQVLGPEAEHLSAAVDGTSPGVSMAAFTDGRLISLARLKRNDRRFGRPLRVANRIGVREVTVATNGRDAFVAWHRRGAVEGAFVYASGRVGAVQRLGSARAARELSVDVSGRRRVIAGWVDGNRIVTAVRSSAGFQPARTLETHRAGATIGGAGIRVAMTDGGFLAVWQGATAVRAAGLANADGTFATPQDLAPLPAELRDLGVGLHDLDVGFGNAALVSLVTAEGAVAAAVRLVNGSRFGPLEIVAGPSLRPPVGLPSVGGLKTLTTSITGLDAAFDGSLPALGASRWVLGWAAAADEGAYVATREADR